MEGMADLPKYEEARERLRRLIMDRGIKWGEGMMRGDVRAKWTFDLREVLLTPEGSYLSSVLFSEMLKGFDFDMVGAPSLAAEAIFCPLIIHLRKNGKNVPGFIVRKEAKSSGLIKLVEGPVNERAKVGLVDDAINQGNSKFRSINLLRQAGCEAVGVVTLVDFRNTGSKNLEERGFKVKSAFVLNDFPLNENKLFIYENASVTEAKFEPEKHSKEVPAILEQYRDDIRGKIFVDKMAGIIFFALSDGVAYAIDSSGDVLWKRRLGIEVHLESQDASILLFRTDSYRVFSLDKGTGAINWSYENKNMVTAVEINEYGVIVGCANGYLYSLDSRSGKVRKSAKIENGNISGVFMNGKEIIVGCEDGKYYTYEQN